VLALVAWFIQTKVENNRIRDEKRVETQRIEAEIKSDVAILKNSTGASLSWANTLSDGKDYRFKPILSIELEKVWLNQLPILFPGSLNDIATLDEIHYQVTFERSLWAVKPMFDTSLRLSLKADKKIIDDFMSKNPKLLEHFGFNNSLVVAAKISKIEVSQISDNEGVTSEIRTGVGELIGIVFIGDVEL
jgi:hypothetical protein